MKKITLLIFAIIISGAAIAKHKHKKKQSSGNAITSVSMRRTACYGRCPEYTIEINENGMATFTGIRFTPDTGTFRKNIGASKAIEIINQFETYRADTCQNGYRNRIEDLSGLILTINYKDSTKTIRNANFGPIFLRQLGQAIDAAGKKTDDSWEKVTNPSQK